MSVKVITPAADVLDLPTMRLHLRLDTVNGVHPDDTLVQAYAAAAVEHAEHYTERSIGVQTLELALDAFPCNGGGIDLSPGPLQSVVSVKYVDTAGVEQTIDPLSYTPDLYSTRPWLVAAAGTTWPETYEAINVVKVQFIAGYSTLPGAVKAALLLITSHLYEHRDENSEDVLKELPLGAKALLGTIKIWSA